MFESKLGCGAFGGAILGIFALIGSLQEGKPLHEALGAFAIMMIFGIGVVFWFTRNMDEDGNEMEPMETSTDDEIKSLQKELRNTLRDAAIHESQGNHRIAQDIRADAAVIESQLRSLGA